MSLIKNQSNIKIKNPGGAGFNLPASSSLATPGVIFLISLIFSGCSIGFSRLPSTISRQTTELNRKNFTVIDTAVTGKSRGFYFLFVFNPECPTISKALENLYSKIQEKYSIKGKSVTLINVVYEKINSFVLIGIIQDIQVTADVIMFIDENNSLKE